MSEYDPNYIPTYALFLISVKVVIYNDNGQILLLRRSDKTSRAHGWDYAGGGVDKGESPVDAAIREVREETGLAVDTVKVVSTSHGYTEDKEHVMIGYSAHTSGDEVRLSWEHESYQWMTVEEARTLDLPEAHRLIMDAYEDMVGSL